MARIIIVDDEACCRNIIESYLKHLGYAVVASCPSATDAIIALNEHPEVDLIISDYSMKGGLNGVELRECVASIWPEIPFLLVSSDPPSNYTGPVLAKPIDHKILAATITTLLNRSHQFA